MNAAGLWQGQADPALSGRGRGQARKLAGALGGEDLSALVASDLARARETAAILGQQLGLKASTHVGLREMDVGAWTGLPHAEIGRRWPEDLARFRAGDQDVRPGGGETRRELRLRVREALREVCADWPESRVAVVTHMGALRSLVPGLELDNAGTFWLNPTNLSAVAQPGPASSAESAAPPEGRTLL